MELSARSLKAQRLLWKELECIDFFVATHGQISWTGIQIGHAAISILEKSGLLQKKLDLLYTVSTASHCSALLHQTHLFTPSQSLQTSLHSVKHLLLSLSHNFALDDGEDPAEISAAAGEHNVPALSKVFQSMPVNEELHFHCFGLRWWDRTEADKREERFFDTCYEFLPFKTLKICLLRSRRVGESALLYILQRSSGRTITLQDIHLCKGIYRPILDILARSKGNLKYFHLEDLIESDNQQRVIYYKVPSKLGSATRGGAGSLSDIVHEGGELQQKLECSFVRGKPFVGSGKNDRWYQ